MKKGMNRADSLQNAFALLESDFGKSELCVFLSHKSLGKASAKQIAGYFSDAGIDYYLDENDLSLQRAASANDPNALTEIIKKGISESTYLLVIISAIAFDSPWIPFEIGFGQAAIGADSRKLALLPLKDAAEMMLPDFMRTAYDIRGTKSLNLYISIITSLNESLLKSETRIFSESMPNHHLDKILKWNA